MGADSGGGGGRVFRVRGRLGQELTAQAGSRGRVGAPSPPSPQEWFLTSSCHRPLCPGPTASSEPDPVAGCAPGTPRLGRLGTVAKQGFPND